MTDVPDPVGPDTRDDLADGPAPVVQLRITLAPTPPPPDARPTRVLTVSGSVYKLDPHTMTAFRLPDGGADSAATANAWPCSAGRNRSSARTLSCTS